MIPYGHHDVDEADIAAVVEVLRGEWLTTGPAVERFEEDLKAWTGGVPVVAVSSGTAALHTAYAAAGIGPGDEVITPPITFIATQATAVMLGATIVFADVQADTANIDPAAVEAAITTRTKAIVAVDYAGHPADMDELRVIADRHGLILIEDAAHSLGSTYRGRPVGSLADITAFSFFPTKNITTAEGGAVAVKDPQMLRKAREFARQGLVRDPSRHILTGEGPWHQEVHSFGLNYRLPDVLAALGSRQLHRLEGFKTRRAEIKAAYDRLLVVGDDIAVPAQRNYVKPTWHLYPVRVLNGRRQEVFVRLRDGGIGVQVNYLPAYRHPAFVSLGYPPEGWPNAERLYREEISLPMHTIMDDRDVIKIANLFNMAVKADDPLDVVL
jgi:dTDP-4-amino-4,6-dideoxygalactose transaminase